MSAVVVPDYMDCLVGYRAWNLTPEGDLVSINTMTEEPWPGKYRKIATCNALRERAWSGQIGASMWASTSSCLTSSMAFGAPVKAKLAIGFADWWERRMEQRKRENHYAPEADCTCGIYAAKSDQTSHYEGYAHEAAVWGEVYLWGKIQEYSEGYRVEFAYPKSLSTSNARLAPRVAERYGVPCVAVERHSPRQTRRVAGITVFPSTTAVYGVGSTQAVSLSSQAQSTNLWGVMTWWLK